MLYWKRHPCPRTNLSDGAGVHLIWLAWLSWKRGVGYAICYHGPHHSCSQFACAPLDACFLARRVCSGGQIHVALRQPQSFAGADVDGLTSTPGNGCKCALGNLTAAIPNLQWCTGLLFNQQIGSCLNSCSSCAVMFPLGIVAGHE